MESRHARQNEFKRGEMPPTHSDEKEEGEKYPPGGKEPEEAAWPAPRQGKTGDKAIPVRSRTPSQRRSSSSKKGTTHAKKNKKTPKHPKRSAASAKKRR